jgi:hypothetical protein
MGEVRSVPQALADLAKIHDERGKDYGDDYMHIGKVLAGYFPEGITLKTPEEFNRFALWFFQVSKLGRYARCMTQGRGHPDSLDDNAVYAMLLQRFDSAVKAREEK